MEQAAASTARARALTPRSSPRPAARSSRIPAVVVRAEPVRPARRAYKGRDVGGRSMTISITRVYTRTGDKGETALVGGKRVPKDSPRIVAYGTVDELNAAVGLARVFNAERLAEGERHKWLDEVLRKVQNQLFDLGSELDASRRRLRGHVSHERRRGEGARSAHGPMPEGSAAAQVLHPAWWRSDPRVPPSGSDRLPSRRARAPGALAGRAHRRVAAALSEPAER